MRRRALLLTTPLGLAGCGSLLPTQKYIPRTIWPLQPPPPTINAANPTGPVLLIRAINPAPGLESRGLQSLTENGNLTVDYYNLWAVPPAEALTQGLIIWAQASGVFSAVVTPGTRLTPGLIVEGEFSKLLVDLQAGRACAQMTLLIIKPSSTLAGFAQPLAQIRLIAYAPVTGTGPRAQAVAQSAAMADLLAQAIDQLERYAGQSTWSG